MNESKSELMTGVEPYREGEWTTPDVEPRQTLNLSDVARALIPPHVREAAERAREVEAALPQPAWTVHVDYVNGRGEADEDRIGEGIARVEGGALIVEVFGDSADDRRVTFHAGWSLRHVHSWWVDYAESDDE